jgi:hypothetical protein
MCRKSSSSLQGFRRKALEYDDVSALSLFIAMDRMNLESADGGVAAVGGKQLMLHSQQALLP